MADNLRITLTYQGPAVDDGTMPADEVIEALQGFSGAYGKVASQVDPNETHQLRVTGVKTGSFELLITAALAGSSYTDKLNAIEATAKAARYVFSLLTELINAKKHAKGKPYTVAVKGTTTRSSSSTPKERNSLYRRKRSNCYRANS
jgi:hypothetical protein